MTRLSSGLETSALRVEPRDLHVARQREEGAISLAASLIQEADAQGYEVGLTVLGLPTTSIPVRRSQWHLTKMMAALASIDMDHPRRVFEGHLPDGLTRVQEKWNSVRAGLRADLGSRLDAAVWVDNRLLVRCYGTPVLAPFWPIKLRVSRGFADGILLT